MHISKPPRLCRGDVIGICAPAGPILDKRKFECGLRYLEQLGYRVLLGKHVYKQNGYLAGTDTQRAGDLNTFFENKHVKAIFCARGGFGVQHILPLLDYRLIRRNPKIVVGYSDITALHLALLSKTGLTSFSGPMVVEMPETFDKKSEEMFWRSMTSTMPLDPLSPTGEVLHHGTRTVASGRLVGGNLSLVAALAGTPYLPDMKGVVLSLEEIDERPYRVDRLLQQLKLSGVLRSAKGVLLGDFTDCTPVKGKPSLTLPEIFRQTFESYQIPVLSGFRYGHVRHSLTLPVGIRVRIDGMKNRMDFLEAAVV